jgi:isopropylmalate/homocitrate/citramalate synthase
MGERAGCGATEEVAVALRILYGIDMGLDLRKFHEASTQLQTFSGVKLQPHKAVVGNGAFVQEAGLVVTGWKENPFTAEAYLPELVGQKPSMLLGKKSGKDSIEIKLKEMGLSVTEAEIADILQEVKNHAQNAKESMKDGAFKTLVLEILKRKKKD